MFFIPFQGLSTYHKGNVSTPSCVAITTAILVTPLHKNYLCYWLEKIICVLIKLRKRKALRKHSLHGKTSASV